jgi:two-component system response regulator
VDRFVRKESDQMSQRPILLVEDNPDDELLTIRALRKNRIGNPIVVAHDGVEALDYIFGTGPHTGRNIADRPQVVLLDLKMPRIDGLQVLQRIRADERTLTLPVVVLTSSREQRDLVDSYRFGCNSYVRKPVNFEEFLVAARELGLYWMLLNQAPALS